jgi:hypothetical protein
VNTLFARHDPAEYWQQKITAVMAAQAVVQKLIGARDGGADED